MTEPALKLPDYQDILNLPAHKIGEIINGRLQVQPRPAPKHTLTSSALGAELFQSFHKKDDGWWILDEPELHLDNHILVPDLAGWRKQRLPQLPETAWFEIAPDWICEILSPGTAKIDRCEKMPVYAELGVAYLWLIDPLLKTLEVYQLQQARWFLDQSLKDNDTVCAEPFSQHSFNLNKLWE